LDPLDVKGARCMSYPEYTPELTIHIQRAEDIAAQHQHLIQVGMRAVIRDIQEFIDGHRRGDTLEVAKLESYLLACLITAGGFE
jgi:hypothetical protein